MDVSEPADGTRKRKPSVRRQEAAGSSTAVSPELKKKSLVRPKKTIAVEDDSEDELGGAAQSQPKKPSQPPRKPRAKPAGTEPPRPTDIPEPAGRDAKTLVKLEVADAIMTSPEKPPRNESGHGALAKAIAEKLPEWAGDEVTLNSWSRHQSKSFGGSYELWDDTLRAQKLEATRQKLEAARSRASGKKTQVVAPIDEPPPPPTQPKPPPGAKPSAAAKPVKPPKKMAFYRLNFAAKPLGKGETEKSGPTTMSFARKKELCRRGIEVLDKAVLTELTTWRAAGLPHDAPPRVSNLAAGSEKGDLRGKLHLQPILEWWDVEGLGDKALKSHVGAWLHSVLDPLLLGPDGEHWDIGGKNKTDKPERAVGGWFYDLSYSHKEAGADWSFTCRRGVDEAEALMLGVHHLETIWPECVAIFGAHDMQAKVRPSHLSLLTSHLLPVSSGVCC